MNTIEELRKRLSLQWERALSELLPMDTIGKLRKLSKRAIRLKEKILKEKERWPVAEREAKRLLIDPFIEALGYDPVDEVEIGFRPPDRRRYVNWIYDWDYTIKKDGKIIMLLKAKNTGRTLDDVVGFGSRSLGKLRQESEGWFRIYTDGAEYRFYSGDPDGAEKKDSQPFLVLDLLNFDETDAETVSTFAKDRFDPKEVRELVGLAKEREFRQKYESAIRYALREELEEPSEELCKLLINKMYVSAKDEDLEQLKPLVKKAANQILSIREDYERKRKELLNELTEKLSGHLLGEKIIWEVCNSETAEIIIPANKKITRTMLKKLAKNYDRLSLMPASPIREKILEIIEPFKPKFEDLKKQRDEEQI